MKLAKTTFTVLMSIGEKKGNSSVKTTAVVSDAVSFDGRTSLSLTERKYVLVEGVRIPELDEIHKRVRHIWLSKEKKKKMNATERHRNR